MSDTDRMAALEDQVEKLEAQLKEVRGELARAELDQWRGRVDSLEVQARLAAMEADDRVAPLMEQLRNRWLDAREEFEKAVSTASAVSESVRNGLEKAIDDLRSGIVDAASSAKAAAKGE